MDILSKNTKFLINISSISFIFLNVYIVYSKVRFDLSTLIFINYLSISILLAFIISTLLLIYKMIIFARYTTENLNGIKYIKIFSLYLFFILYSAFITLFKQENFYSNMIIDSIISVLVIFCLTHFFFVIKFSLRTNKNV